MDLIVKKKIINGDLKSILEKLRMDAHKPYLFKDMKASGDSLMTQCPYHSGGKESRPSCGFVNTRFGKSENYKMHCFSCGKIVSLPQLAAYLFGSDIEFAETWLVNNFGGDAALIDELPEIDLNFNKETFMDESILNNYDYYHPYMWKRKLSKEVVDKYRVGFDPVRKCLTFPVWDSKGRLKLITTRSVDTKQFYINEDQNKPVYLLNFIMKEGVTDKVHVCESQINSLTLESYGYRSIALLGTGSYPQYKILKNSGIRHFTLCLDGDKAGRLGTKRFINNAKLDVLIDVVEIPNGKDVNDLTKEEFDSLPRLSSFEWLQKYGKDLD